MTKSQNNVKVKENQRAKFSMNKDILPSTRSFTNKKNTFKKRGAEKKDPFRNHFRIMRYLQKTYPKAFNRSQFKPLKKKILEDILSQEGFPFSENNLREALHVYIFSARYLQCFQFYSERYDLEGTPCDVIREKEKKYVDPLLYPHI